MQSVRERMQELCVHGRRQVTRLLGIEMNPASKPGGDAVRESGELMREPAGEDRPEDRNAEGSANRAEERRRRRRDAHVLRAGVVLNDEDDDLHDEADADADNEHVHGCDPWRAADVE